MPPSTNHVLTFARSKLQRLCEVWYHTDPAPYFADAVGSNSGSKDVEQERRRAVQGRYTAHCDGLVSPCSGARVNASQRCSDAGFRPHSTAGAARDGWVAPESAGDHIRRDERSKKDDADYRRTKTVGGKERMAMIEGLVVTANRAACEAVRIREVGMKNRCSDD